MNEDAKQIISLDVNLNLSLSLSPSQCLSTCFCLLPSCLSLPPSLPLFSLAAAVQTVTAPPASPAHSVSLSLCLPVSLSLSTGLPPPSPLPSLSSPLSVRTCSRGSGDEAPKCLLPDGLVVRAVRAGLPVLVHRLQQLQR